MVRYLVFLYVLLSFVHCGDSSRFYETSAESALSQESLIALLKAQKANLGSLTDYKSALQQLDSLTHQSEKHTSSMLIQSSSYDNVEFWTGFIPWKHYALDEPSDEQVAASLFLNHYSGLFGLQDPVQELRFKQSTYDFLGSHHVRYDQYYQGLPVFGAQVIVHLDKTYAVTGVNGQFVPRLDLKNNPKISKDIAVQRAWEEISKQQSEKTKTAQADSIELVVFDRAIVEEQAVSQPRLSWQVSLAGHIMLIDANDGSLQLVSSLQHHNLSIQTHDVNGEELFAPRDGTLRLSQRGIDGPHIAHHGYRVGTHDYIDNLHDFAEETYQYFNIQHQRDSFDGRGSTITLWTNFNENRPNASWSLYLNVLKFHRSYSHSRDTMGHEFTHGVINSTAALLYYGQSGALNEALADFFGTMVDFNGAGSWWNYGENDPGQSIDNPTRDMRDPTKGGRYQPNQCDARVSDPPQPAHMDVIATEDDTCRCYPFADYNCVHVNSGIINKVSYLLVGEGRGLIHNFGGVSVLTIGKDRTEDIFYRALVNYLTPTSNFSTFRNSAVRACHELYGVGHNDCRQVAQAFAAVGIGRSNNAPRIAASRSVYGYGGELPRFEVDLPVGHRFYTIELATDWRLFNDLPAGQNRRRPIGRVDNNFISTDDIYGAPLSLDRDGDQFIIPIEHWLRFRRNLWKDWEGRDLTDVVFNHEDEQLTIAEALDVGGNIYYRVKSSPDALGNDFVYSHGSVNALVNEVDHEFPSVSLVRYHLNGTLVKSDNSLIYLIEYGRKRLASVAALRDHRLNPEHAVSVSDLELASYPEGIMLPEGLHYRLRSQIGSNTIWYQAPGSPIIQPIRSSAAFDSWGFDWDEIEDPVHIVDGVRGPVLYMRDGTLVQEQGRPEIYFVSNGVARHILNTDIYYALLDIDYNDFSRVQVVPQGTLAHSTVSFAGNEALTINASVIGLNQVALTADSENAPWQVRDITAPQVSLAGLNLDLATGNESVAIPWQVSDDRGVVGAYLYYSADGWETAANA